ncbi:MAG TPA: hypothetical protein VHU81_13845 [Thermoanaerobaculia bacterium]|nr:hypothetical protein [Thermoanaerobaculia bacterium]
MPIRPLEMLLPLVLFVLFTVLSTAGAYLVLSRNVSRAAGIWAAVATLLFFVAIAWGLVWMMRGSGLL